MAGVPEMETTSAALYFLDYLYPLSIAVTFASVNIANACSLKPQKETPKKAQGRNLALCLSLATILSYVLQAVLYLTHALLHKGWWAQQHLIINVLACILVWGSLFILLLGSPSPSWDTYAAAWVVGLAFEIAIGILFLPAEKPVSTYCLLRVGLQGLRIAFLLGLVLNAVVLLRSHEQTASDEERQSLLANDGNGSTTKPAGYETIAAETEANTEQEGEEDPDDKEVKEKQRQRLETQGWIGYLKEFSMFLPYVFPAGNWKIQFCLFLCFVDMISDRFLNVLIPNQVGIITDKLTSGSSMGIMPWREVLLWTFFKWFKSSAGFGLVHSICLAKVQQYSYARLKTLTFEHVMGLSMDFHSNKDSGEVLKSVEQAESLNDLVELVCFQVGPVFIDMIVALVYITYLFDAYLAFVVVVVGVVYTWMGISLTQRIRAKRRSYVEKSRHENRTLYESIANWQSVSYFNRIPHEEVKYKGTVTSAVTAQMSYLYTFWLGYGAQSLVMTLGLLTASFLAVYQISSGQKPVGNFVTLVMYWNIMMSPLSSLAYSWRRISSTLVDAERLLQLIQSKPSVENRPEAKALIVKGGQVDFKNVDFSYDARKQTIQGLTFTAKPGQTVAFVGETGGGKSTTLKLLFRFYDVTGGSIFIDGQDIRDVTLDSLREVIGIVPQDPALFNQTVMENVRYARLDATDDEIMKACKAAAVHEKIMSFPDQYQSKVGERGVKLSGGELQRIAIARIFIKNPQIVLLDEATSAVDSTIESQIQAAFKELSAGRTTFVIAHRLSTIVEADKIIVIDQGKILESGTHNELLEMNGKYFELWMKQTAGKSSSVSSGTATSSQENLLLDISSELDSKHVGNGAQEISILGQVDGVCDSKIAFESKSDKGGCFGKQLKAKHQGEGSDSSSLGDDSDSDGPIRMISAKPTDASDVFVSQLQDDATEAERTYNFPESSITFTINPGTPHSPHSSIPEPQPQQRRGSGFPFQVAETEESRGQVEGAMITSTLSENTSPEEQAKDKQIEGKSTASDTDSVSFNSTRGTR